ncbi:transmembrane prolyl 4-hydroxylase-like isoform X2 [Xenia sp. Carnegie-2017]|nr:transmembrane prolyl 4-hydroxylase-like isoform X2 [Xenia sp. Carnegie-2017]
MVKIHVNTNIATMFKDEIQETFNMWNLNGDEYVDANEVAYVYGKAAMFLSKQKTLEMLKETKIDRNNDGKLDINEFKSIDKEAIDVFFEKHKKETSSSVLNKTFTRQTWLWHDEDELLAYEDLFDDYHERIQLLTRLPKKIIENSEPMQVVNYEHNGYHHCHHDTHSFSKELPCCQYGSSNCRICRYLTIMVYLNDDYEGGEKCFPFADNDTFSQKDLPREFLKKCNFEKNCNTCNVLVKPKRGKAVIWYNHLLHSNSAWLGALDANSGHGDCRSKGDKWIANIWINIIGDGKYELRSWKSGTNWIKPGNKFADIYSILGNPDLKTEQHERNLIEINFIKGPDTNTNFGDSRQQFYRPGIDVETEDEKNYKHSNVLKSIILLLDELSNKEQNILKQLLQNRLDEILK